MMKLKEKKKHIKNHCSQALKTKQCTGCPDLYGFKFQI